MNTEFSPLMKTIIEREGLPLVDHDGLDAFAGDKPYLALLFTGDAERLAESDDLAVIFPELIKASKGVLSPAVVERTSERLLQRRFRFNRFPSMVLLRHGEYLGVMQGVVDWADYMRELPEILAREPSDPPPFKMPDGCAPQSPTTATPTLN